MIRRIFAVAAVALAGMSAFGVSADKSWVERTFARSNLTARVEALESAPYCTIAVAQAMTNGVMDEVRRSFLPATYEDGLFSWVVDVPLYVPQFATVADLLARDSLVVGAWERLRSDFTQQNLPQYLDEREAALTNGLASKASVALSLEDASNNVVVASMLFASWVSQFEWDADESICYRRRMEDGHTVLYAVTNVDFTVPANWPALRAYMEAQQ